MLEYGGSYKQGKSITAKGCGYFLQKKPFNFMFSCIFFAINLIDFSLVFFFFFFFSFKDRIFYVCSPGNKSHLRQKKKWIEYICSLEVGFPHIFQLPVLQSRNFLLPISGYLNVGNFVRLEENA